MKKLLLVAVALAASIPAFAGNWTFQQFGPNGFYNGNDGSHYTTFTNGNTTFWNGMDAYGHYHSGNIQHFGNNSFGFGN
jgi:hypothetical protein